MSTNSHTALQLAGPLSGDGLTLLLVAAAERHMYASLIIEGATASGIIHIVNGQIALVGSKDVKTTRIAQHELTNLLRESIGAPTGTYRCAPLTDIEGAHELRAVEVRRVLTAVGAMLPASAPFVEQAPRRTPAANPAILVATEPTLGAPATTPNPTTAVPEPASAAEGTPVAAVDRPVRASQLRKMLRLKGAAKKPAENATVEKILAEPDETVDRSAALRSVIRDLAS